MKYYSLSEYLSEAASKNEETEFHSSSDTLGWEGGGGGR
jgi:hypothetical protein